MENRRCGFCRTTAPVTTDTAKERAYTCPACGAVETIIKTGGSGWWYCGWKRPDGAKLRAPTVAEMDNGLFGWQPE